MTPAFASFKLPSVFLISMISWACLMISFWDGEVGWGKWCLRKGGRQLKKGFTPGKFHIAPKARQSQKETHLPTILFQVLCSISGV